MPATASTSTLPVAAPTPFSAGSSSAFCPPALPAKELSGLYGYPGSSSRCSASTSTSAAPVPTRRCFAALCSTATCRTSLHSAPRRRICRGVDTLLIRRGWNSVFAFPLSGRAPFTLSWDDFATNYFTKMESTGVVKSMKDFYWGHPAQPEYGTIELRVCDTPLTVQRAAALACYLQALCRHLLERNEPPPEEDDYLVYNYNRFQACCFGMDGMMVNPKTREQISIREDVLATLRVLQPHMLELDSCPPSTSWKKSPALKGNHATLAAAVLCRIGSVQGVVRSAVDALRIELVREYPRFCPAQGAGWRFCNWRTAMLNRRKVLGATVVVGVMNLGAAAAWAQAGRKAATPDELRHLIGRATRLSVLSDRDHPLPCPEVLAGVDHPCRQGAGRCHRRCAPGSGRADGSRPDGYFQRPWCHPPEVLRDVSGALAATGCQNAKALGAFAEEADVVGDHMDALVASLIKTWASRWPRCWPAPPICSG